MSRAPLHGAALFLLGFACLLPNASFGQMISTGVPLVGARHSFFENIGINSGFSVGGFSSPFNRYPAVPQFGGFTPGAGLNGGFGIHSGHFGAHLGFNFAQGSSRSIVSNTPIVTGYSGFPMLFQNSVQRPFVTGVFPVVGNGAVLPNLGAANTIPGRLMRGEFRMVNHKVVPAGGFKPKPQPAGTTQVAERRPLVDQAPPTRAEREAAAQAEQTEKQLAIQEFLRKGREAEAEGKRSVARLYFQMAARRAEGDLKSEALASLERVRN